MADLSTLEVQTLRQRLLRAAPHLQDEIDALAGAAAHRLRVEWVEVTHQDGTRETMPVDQYQRLTALDLAHTRLRVLSAREAEGLPR